MSQINDILIVLKDDLEKRIKLSISPYKTSISEVKRGRYYWKDIVNKPCICFAIDSNPVEEEVHATMQTTNQVRGINLDVYCYMENDEVNEYKNIHNFIKDIKYFFKHDFTYRVNTQVGDVNNIMEGGSALSGSYFEMEVQIIYKEDF